jgi:hypothetical protein
LHNNDECDLQRIEINSSAITKLHPYDDAILQMLKFRWEEGDLKNNVIAYK